MIREILFLHFWQISILYQIFFAAVLYLLIRKWRKRKMLKMLRNFYSKPTLPLIGNLHYIIGRNMKERITKMLNMLLDIELPGVGWIFHIPLVIIGTPDDMRLVLNKTNDRGLLRLFRKSFSEGILLSQGEKWRKSRRIISSAFSAPIMQQYLKVFNEYSEILIKKTASRINTNVAFDIWDHIVHLNADIIFQNMSGYELRSQENGNIEFVEALEESVELDSTRYYEPLLYFDFIYNIYLHVTGKWKVFEIVTNLTTKLIQDLKSKKLQRQQSKDKDVGPKTLLETLLEVHEVDIEFRKENVKEELLNVILAGGATTARATSFLLLMLAMHQDIQEKVYQEIRTIFGNNNMAVEMEDINRLVYLEQCVKETLRKYTIIPITFRKHTQDIQLNDKQTIPANCHTVVAIYALHHNEQIYPNPEIWDPERFSPEATRERDKYAFLPFGLGPRTCIGARYAMVSIKTQMLHFIRNYRFTTDLKMDEIELGLDAALRCENGYWLKLWKRENNK